MVNIIKQNFQIDSFYTTYDNDSNVAYNNGFYNINPVCLLWRKNMGLIYFFEGNPNPINFKSADKHLTVNAENFKSINKQKIIKDLVTDSKILIFIMLMIGGCLLILVAIALKVFGLIDMFKKGDVNAPQ